MRFGKRRGKRSELRVLTSARWDARSRVGLPLGVFHSNVDKLAVAQDGVLDEHDAGRLLLLIPVLVNAVQHVDEVFGTAEIRSCRGYCGHRSHRRRWTRPNPCPFAPVSTRAVPGCVSTPRPATVALRIISTLPSCLAASAASASDPAASSSAGIGGDGSVFFAIVGAVDGCAASIRSPPIIWVPPVRGPGVPAEADVHHHPRLRLLLRHRPSAAIEARRTPQRARRERPERSA